MDINTQMAKTEKKYKDIIYSNHPESNKRPKMDLYIRAAQFAPFAALIGYEDIIIEDAREVLEKIDINDDLKNNLDQKLFLLKSNINNLPKITIMYFEKDCKKDGGDYKKIDGRLKKIDEYKNVLVLDNKKEVSIFDIIDIESEIFYKI